MKNLFLFISVSIFSITSVGQHFVSSQHLVSAPASQFKIIISKAAYDVDAYKIMYNTTDVDGTPTIASGIVAVPKGRACDSLGMVSYAHGTVLKKESVPSRNTNETFIAMGYASTGAVTVAPDYLGLGDNPGLHPYMHAESEATATIDLIRAAKEYLRDTLGVYLSGELFSTGYSQGGHASMATVKYIQDNGLLSKFDVVAAGPASGPYNLSGTQAKNILSNQPYSNPGYICYMLFGLNRVYGNFFQNYSDILKSPYDTLIPPYFDGTYDMATVNALLPDTISGYIQDSVLANFRNDSVAKNHPIWQAMLAQDNFDWKPSFPIEMYYCTLDEQVDFKNALDAEMAMNAKGANATAVDKGAQNHGGCVIPALLAALDFYHANTNSCTISLTEMNLSHTVKMYPNPADDYVIIEAEEKAVQIRVYNSSGDLVISERGSTQTKIQTESWSRGFYLVQIIAGEEISSSHLIVR